MSPVARVIVISSQWGSPDRSETSPSGFRQQLLNEGGAAYLIHVHSSLRNFVIPLSWYIFQPRLSLTPEAGGPRPRQTRRDVWAHVAYLRSPV